MIEFNAKFTTEQKEELIESLKMIELFCPWTLPQTQKEFDEWCEETLAKHRKEEEKKAKAKVRKEEREKAKAEELGLTIEEYKAKVKHDKKVREAEKRVEALKAELTEAQKYLEKIKKGA